MLDWLSADNGVAWWLAGISLVSFVASLILLPILIVRMPADYFVRPETPDHRWRDRHPAVRAALVLVKNGIGLVLLLFGLIMLVTPGQGILAILVGVSLMDVPGKRALEARIVSNPTVLGAINSLRARAGRSPLQVPSDA